MSDKGNQSGVQVLKKLEKEAFAKLDAIRNQIMTSTRSEDENIQITLDVVDALDDVLLHWEETYVPDMLKILDKDDLD